MTHVRRRQVQVGCTVLQNCSQHLKTAHGSSVSKMLDVVVNIKDKNVRVQGLSLPAVIYRIDSYRCSVGNNLRTECWATDSATIYLQSRESKMVADWRPYIGQLFVKQISRRASPDAGNINAVIWLYEWQLQWPALTEDHSINFTHDWTHRTVLFIKTVEVMDNAVRMGLSQCYHTVSLFTAVTPIAKSVEPATRPATWELGRRLTIDQLKSIMFWQLDVLDVVRFVPLTVDNFVRAIHFFPIEIACSCVIAVYRWQIVVTQSTMQSFRLTIVCTDDLRRLLKPDTPYLCASH